MKRSIAKFNCAALVLPKGFLTLPRQSPPAASGLGTLFGSSSPFGKVRKLTLLLLAASVHPSARGGSGMTATAEIQLRALSGSGWLRPPDGNQRLPRSQPRRSSRNALLAPSGSALRPRDGRAPAMPKHRAKHMSYPLLALGVRVARSGQPLAVLSGLTLLDCAQTRQS